MQKNFFRLSLLYWASSLLLVALLWGCQTKQIPPVNAEKRVLLLSPNLAEMVWYLDSGEMVVGVSAFTDFPVQAANKPIVVSGAGLDLERALGLAPTLAVGIQGFNSAQDVAALREAGCQVVMLQLNKVQDLVPAFKQLAELLDLENNKKVDDLEVALLSARQPSIGPPILMLMPGSPAMAFTEGGFPGSLLAWAGGRNELDANLGGFPFFEEEALSSLSPVGILLLGEGQIPEAVLESWQQKGLNPVVQHLDPDVFFRPGPRTLDALQALQRALSEIRKISP